ncbi:MAG: hypothetical protein GY870_03855 [archaeon]|nr:hypothetical protein [archaeon]
MSKDPKFLIVKKYQYTEGINEPDLIFFDISGNLILRHNEVFLSKFMGTVELLRYPEYFQIISAEKYSWEIIITSDRIVCKQNLNEVFGAFELMDHIDNNGVLVVVDPNRKLNLKDMFKFVNKREKNVKDYILTFQIANTRISNISITKVEGPNELPKPGAIELWYKDSSILTDSSTQIIIYPKDLYVEDPYLLGLQIHKYSLEEKLKCVNKKHELDTTWSVSQFNTLELALKRLIQRPKMLAQGSGSLDSDSWDPIIFQTHPIQWLSDIFSRSLKKGDKFSLTM